MTVQDCAAAQEAVLLERLFAAHGYAGEPSNPEVIEVVGKTPILLSCPHATNHPREGTSKRAEIFTGALTLQLARRVGASALIAARTTEEDPNYDTDGPYKHRLRALVAQTRARFVLDIHGLQHSRRIDVAFGTDHGVTLGERTVVLTLFVDAFQKAGFPQCEREAFFSASRPTTIASFAWRICNVPALQLEIHHRYRDPTNDPHAYTTLLVILCETLGAIQSLL